MNGVKGPCHAVWRVTCVTRSVPCAGSATAAVHRTGRNRAPTAVARGHASSYGCGIDCGRLASRSRREMGTSDAGRRAQKFERQARGERPPRQRGLGQGLAKRGGRSPLARDPGLAPRGQRTTLFRHDACRRFASPTFAFGMTYQSRLRRDTHRTAPRVNSQQRSPPGSRQHSTSFCVAPFG